MEEVRERERGREGEREGGKGGGKGRCVREMGCAEREGIH